MHVWGITVATASPNDKFNKFLCLPPNKINIIYHYNETALMQTCIVPLPRQEPGHSSVCQQDYTKAEFNETQWRGGARRKKHLKHSFLMKIIFSICKLGQWLCWCFILVPCWLCKSLHFEPCAVMDKQGLAHMLTAHRLNISITTDWLQPSACNANAAILKSSNQN